MSAEENFSQRRRRDCELLVRGVQAGMPGGRHDDIEIAVSTAAIRQGLSKGDAIETYRRLAAEDRVRFQQQNDRRVGMKLLGLAIAALDNRSNPDVARSRCDEACGALGLSRVRMRKVFDKVLADRRVVAEAKADRTARRRTAR